MSTKVHQILLAAIAITSSGIAAGCADEGPCVQGDNGECIGAETGGLPPLNPECAPFKYAEVGNSVVCQGEGTGWLVTEVYGAGEANPITSCLNYTAESVPEHPTSDDCGSIALDMIPYNIPSPTACCTDDALDQDFIDTCVLDCAFSACKTAAAAIRDSADQLVAPSELLEDAYNTSKADLHALADFLETPSTMEFCATLVTASPGEVVSFGLNSGPSNPATFGHIQQATLFLGCTLDPNDPYIPNPSGDECTEATNIPAELAEQESRGTINIGTIRVADSGLNSSVQLSNIEVSTREILHRDMSMEFVLTAFNTSIPDVAAGSFQFRDVQIGLATPASGMLEGETVTFAPGALRFEVTATVLVNGMKWFGGLPLTAEYGNAATATAARGMNGSFHLVEAAFTAGETTVVLDTQPSILAPIR